MKRSWQIVCLAVIVLLSVFFFGARLHYASIREVTTRFQEQQLLHAHHIAERIENFFNGHAQVLKTFSTPVSLQHESMDQLRNDLRAYSRNMQAGFVKKISLYDASGMIIYSTDEDAVGLQDGKNRVFVWSEDSGNKSKLFAAPLDQAVYDSGAETGNQLYSPPGGLQFVLAAPLYAEADGTQGPGQEEKFLGALCFTVDLLPFLLEELHDSPMLLHDAWIIDQGGSLLYHSRHPGIKSGNIYHEGEGCKKCHDSFDYVREILVKKEGALAFETKTPAKKLAGIAPMNFEGMSWVVVADSEDSRITSYLSRNLRDHLLLFGIAAFALTWSTVLVYRNYQSGKRVKEEMASLKERHAERERAAEVLAESEQRLRTLSTRLLTAQEKERSRISRELHDELGQSLAAVKLQIRQIADSAGKGQTEIKGACGKTQDYLDRVIEDVRRLSRDLSPTVLEHFGLSAALRRLFSDFAKNYNIEVSIDMIDAVDQLFSRDDQAIVYRIFQEAVHNVGKHAQATRLQVTGVRYGNEVSFTIEDNGKGFDMHDVSRRDIDRRGMGLDIMQERAGMLGGTLEVSSREGKGTRITLRVPVAEEGNT